MEEVRIQKYLSDCGVLSRRAAEKAIEEGRVKINGENAVIGQKIDPSKDEVYFDGRHIIKKRSAHYVYIMLNKPAGYVTTMSDDKGRKTVASLVSDAGTRVYPVGRLDMDSEGLLLMTNDGEFTNLMTHPRHNIPKIYKVVVEGFVTKQILSTLSGEMNIDGYDIRPVECMIENVRENSTAIRMILYEGRNRQIRKMCEAVGLTVKKLKREAIGDLELDVKKGSWRYLRREEVDYLRENARAKK